MPDGQQPGQQRRDVDFPALTPLSTVAKAERPAALLGVAIPTRNRTIRRRVVGLYEQCSWLNGADVSAATRWAVLGEKFTALAKHLESTGVLTAAGDPRKTLAELRAMSGEIGKIETQLGITASARASLGITLLRTPDLAEQLQALREREA